MRTCIYNEKYWVFMLVSSFFHMHVWERRGAREHVHNMKVFVSCIGIARRCISPSECVCVCMYTVIIVRVCCGEYHAFAKNLLCLSN